MPEAVNDPVLNMLWGITTERVRAWARQEEGGLELTESGVAGHRRGPCARGDRRSADQRRARRGHPGLPDHFPCVGTDLHKVKAVVTDIVCRHAAIVCREYGLPAVVGTGRATSQIQTGQLIRVDGTAGTVAILEAGSDPPA